MEKKIKEIAQYCAENIENWDIKCGMALSYIGKRMPIPAWFRSEIEDAMDEWSRDNEVEVDEITVEDIVLWEDC